MDYETSKIPDEEGKWKFLHLSKEKVMIVSLNEL